jgi:hypothetical protein
MSPQLLFILKIMSYGCFVAGTLLISHAAFLFAPYIYLPPESFFEFEKEAAHYKKMSVLYFCSGLIICWFGILVYLIRDLLI